MAIQTAAEWARAEFGEAKLGDGRRTARAVKCARALAETPGGTLPEPLKKGAELKAAYRLLSNPKVTFGGLQSPHWERIRQGCREHGEYLLIEDTTQLDFSGHEAVDGLGTAGGHDKRAGGAIPLNTTGGRSRDELLHLLRGRILSRLNISEMTGRRLLEDSPRIAAP